MPSWKDSVRAATTGDLNPFPPTAHLTVDDVALRAGDRVLVKGQADSTQNGIWTVAAHGSWTRANDASSDAQIEPEMSVRVSEGTSNGHTEWTLTTQGRINLGTTGLTFTQTNVLNLFWGETSFRGWAISDADIVSVSNKLEDGRSDNPQAFLAASLAGYGGICTGIRGRNGNGSSLQPTVGMGVYGDSDNGYGVYGSSATSVGVSGTSESFDGISGSSTASNHAGVAAVNDSGGFGLWARGTPAGHFEGSVQVNGTLTANSPDGQAIVGNSTSQDAINGTSASPIHAGVSANNTAEWSGAVPSGFAVWAHSNATGIFAHGNPAAYFEGDVQVTGDVVLINSPTSGDVAEDFDLEDDPEHAEPGTVLIIGANGKLASSLSMYDTRVAGVVSGAGTLRPALVLQRVKAMGRRSPIALIGKVFCKVDASFGSITAGDLLTTSATRGHAMKVADRSLALGAILGKALGPLDSGRGLIPILVSLR